MSIREDASSEAGVSTSFDVAALQRIVASDLAGRKASSACRELYWEAALDLCLAAKSTAIVTGFFIASVEASETDGPPGSVVLGRALQGLGGEVRLVTDERNSSVLSACSRAVKGPEVLTPDRTGLDAAGSPDLLIFLERPGRAADGRYYNMNGVDVSSVVSPLDDMALSAMERGVSVLGIGDGGNEAGMGLLYGELVKLLPEYAPFLSCVPSTVCLPVDVSNWGGYALAALLSASCGRWLGLSAGEEEHMLEAALAAGAVDGGLRTATLSVDCFPLVQLDQISSQIRDWYRGNVHNTSEKA